MRREIVTALRAIVLLTLLLGLAYPLAVTAVSQIVFPGRADGSARLIGRDYKQDPRYFQSRPSTATDYNAAASAFTNLGPNSKDARDAFREALAAYLKLERPYDRGLTAAQVPVDAVTSSASGIDPHISPANAAIQAHRVATVRHLPLSRVKQLITDNTDGRSLGVLGEPGVNVRELDQALDQERR
jgi:K+-transporting ATPase ATPase C chain